MQSAIISSVDRSWNRHPYFSVGQNRPAVHRFVRAQPLQGLLGKKRIRAAHAEKQQIRKTCNRPNRLNLSVLTAEWGRRSKFFCESARFSKRRRSPSRCFPLVGRDSVEPEPRQLVNRSARRSLALPSEEKLRLFYRSHLGCLVSHLLKQRF